MVEQIEKRMDVLESLNLDGRVRYVEECYGSFVLGVARDADKIKREFDRAQGLLDSFEKREKKLNERIRKLENVLGQFCLFTYEVGFFTPDNRKEQDTIAKLKEQLAKKESRLKEIEEGLDSLKRAKK